MVTLYVLVDPRNGEIRYVGQTTKTLEVRLKDHTYARGDHYRAKWLRLLKRLSLKPIIRAIQQVPPATWESAEQYWIKFFKACGCRLVNTAEGGRGIIGFRPSLEQRARQSAAQKGRVFSIETRRKIGAATRNRVVSADTRAKMSVSRRGQPISDKAREARKGRQTSTAARIKISEALKGLKRSDATRAKMSEGRRLAWAQKLNIS